MNYRLVVGKSCKMIKLRLIIEVSLSKVVLGVAGISATICALQYFSSKENKPKGSSKKNVEQNKTDSYKINKVSNLVSAKSTIEPKLSKDKSAKCYFNNRKHENDFIKFSSKSKGLITPIKKKRH